MKTYNMDITYFDGCEWKYVTKTIVATTMIQLIKTFISETHCLHENSFTKSRKEIIKELWNYSKKFITQEELTFPIVTINYIN